MCAMKRIFFTFIILIFDLFCNDNSCFRIFAWPATLSAHLF